MNHFFGRNLKLIRHARGLSQAQLGKEMGKGQKTIGNWETGYSEPNLHELISISHFFQIDLDSLLKYDLRYTDIAPKPVQPCNEINANETANTQTILDDIKRLWKEELKGYEDRDDDIAWRDRYIAILEARLYEEMINQIPQKVLQNTVSKLLAIHQTVTELTIGKTGDL